MDNTHNTKNYFTDGGDTLVIGGKLELGGDAKMPHQDPNSAGTTATLKEDLNALLTKLIDAGLMAGAAFSMTVTKSLTSANGDANRLDNIGQIDSVAESDGVITITLKKKVSELKDSDGGSSWGVHKWLGIGVSAGVNPITGLTYNGKALTADDVTEATNCGLSAGYFVRWVAADLVLAGDNRESTKDCFTLKASGYEEKTFTLKIVEPNE